MQELELRTRPPLIDSNYQVLREHLTKELERYDVVVTRETLKDSKAMATELNKLKTTLNNRRKSAVKEISAPIKEFDDQMKELAGMCEQGRSRILEQVKRFEDEQLIAAEQAIEAEIGVLYERQKIEPEFQMIDKVDIKPKLTTLTASGKLTKAAREEIAAAVGRCKEVQQKVQLRLSQLENHCHRAGLHSPLTREHVSGVLFDSDEVYERTLSGLIERELARQAETERRTQERVEAERQATIEAERQAAFAARQEAHVQPEEMTEPAEHNQETVQEVRAPAPGGMRNVDVVIKLSMVVPENITDDRIRQGVKEKMVAAGFKSLSSISAYSIKKQEAA